MQNTTLEINIGSILFSVDFGSLAWLEQNQANYTNFIVDSFFSCSKDTVRISAECSSDYNSIRRLDTDADVPFITFDDTKKAYSILWHGFSGEFNLTTKQGLVKSSSHTGVQSYLRFVCSILLLPQKGFLVHAASLARNGKAYLFPGKSGAGKSTIAKLSKDATLLTDEISLVRKINDKFYLFGTPFWGELAVGGKNISVPIEAIYFHKKAKANSREKVSAIQSLQMLLPNVVFWLEDAAASKELFNTCFDFVQSAPNYKLYFLPEPSFWDVIY